MADASERERFKVAQELSARLLYGNIDRREFLRRAAVAGLSVPTISMILAACGGDDDEDPTATTAAEAATPTTRATSPPVLPSTSTPASGGDATATTGDAEPTATEAAEEPTATEEASGSEPVEGGTLVFGDYLEPPGLDPGGLCNVACHTVAMHMYDSLLAMDTEFTIYPWIATSWELSEDMMGYIFTLRDDVVFHDGTPLNGEAVKYTFDRIALPETGATSAAVIMGQFYDTTNVIDEFTVEVRFTQPYAPFLAGCTTAWTGIVSPTAAQESGPDFPTNPVGSGPFVFQEWVAQQSTTMTANPDYNWASDIFEHNGRPYLDEIRFQYVPESATRQALLDTGEAQFIDAVPPQNVATVEGNASYQMLIAQRPGGPKMVDLNTAKPPLDQLEVRQALNFAFNKQELIDTVFFGVFEPAGSPLAPVTFGYEPGVEDMYPFDLEQAAALLDQAGWVMGDGELRVKDGQEFRLNCLIGQSEEDAAIAQVMQAQWAPLGIAIDINVIAGTALTTAKQAGEHNIGFKIAVYQDPDILGAYFHPSSVGGFNYTFWTAPELGELLDRGVSTLDPTERAQVYSELSFYMMENALLIPIYYLSNLSAATVTLQGLKHDPTGFYWFYDAWFQEG